MRSLVLGTRKLTVTSAWLVPVMISSVLVVVVSAAAAAAIETRTVDSFPRGLWWATSLITTVGFIGEPPETTAGAVLSALLMVLGFLLLAMVSASLAALFVREEELPLHEEESSKEQEMLDALHRLEQRLDAIEARLGEEPGPVSGPGG